MARATCDHEVLEEGLECSTCSHVVPDCDLDDPISRATCAIQVQLTWEAKTPTLAEPGTSLCKRCQSMTIDKLCSTKGYVHSVCYWALVASAKVSLCPMCIMMVDELQGAEGQDFDYSVALENPYDTDRFVLLRAVSRERRSQKNNLEIKIMNLRLLLFFRSPGLLSVTVTSGVKSTEHAIPQRQLLRDAKEFETMKQWLDLRHPQHAGSQRAMPTRILDLNPTVGEIQLVESKSLGSQCEAYMALSYRWGEGNLMTTTLETFADRKVGIKLKDMPKTIQDAVVVTRRLQVRYLWIDALCIIQDSVTDWSQEAKSMGTIYTNAYCTIAAHSAHHANDGFLEKSLARSKEIQLGVNSSGSEGTFWISRGSNHRGQIDRSELSSRGWVLQERILSTSTIHMANDGVIYLESTREMRSLDGAIDVAPLKTGGIRTMIEKDTSQGDVLEGEMETITANIYRDWYKLVWLYSQCSLTESKDKIPALTGIITQIHKFTGDRCFMGVWQRRAAQGLLWVRGPKKLEYATPSRGPSWSWTTFDGLVGFPKWNPSEDDMQIQTEFAGIEFDSSDDPVGNLSGHCELRITGAKMLRDFSFTTLHPKGGTGLRFLEAQTGDPSLVNVILWESLTCLTRFWGVADDAGEKVGWAAFDVEEAERIDGEDDCITCIAISSHSDRQRWQCGFLVLFVKKLESGYFQRVGIGQIVKTELFNQVPLRDIIII
ncbi:heterokaryon incompatibility protein-domain-containing protein [Pyrenochaeta sp. MPI-SDFR-AT-0127]|nr:heterokaryon incompatibility protein-domain-containing protein [Pyrenochaeta sp. MPI-SDFR-AT-0127]